jgi:hypothetical protein
MPLYSMELRVTEPRESGLARVPRSHARLVPGALSNIKGNKTTNTTNVQIPMMSRETTPADGNAANGDTAHTSLDFNAVKSGHLDVELHQDADATEGTISKSSSNTNNSLARSLSQRRFENLARHLVPNSNGHKNFSEEKIETLKFVAPRLAKRAEEARR